MSEEPVLKKHRNDDDTTTILLDDGTKVQFPSALASQCITLKNCMEDIERQDDAIPVPGVSNASMLVIVKYLEDSSAFPRASTDSTHRLDYSEKTHIKPLDQDALEGVLFAANFLEIPALIESCARVVAERIATMKPTVIHKMMYDESEIDEADPERIEVVKENMWKHN